ncbi:GNAT family N-acetyltransferase [Microbacterium oxydans]|jgi:putative acetyltransferase|uniref:GNAT family N-acetyltransferase n=1 Tax=Microbacterium TaxID=33882 RepID=UPI000733DF8F|nr:MULTISPECIES: GNAT family N-acetyltransferase [Microbacterium]KAB1889305.1 GNAT family N-acetyltransferase [Microbacterium oxydans]KTR75661.1 GCN5 family acetyltransferase [Microbacterium oxydans]MBE7956130.1 GNAT family N-acetyltransferase [Microbacterium sp. R1]MCB8043389.1 GNAT family N-acetyltransferase [Microbacterium oxydans]NYF28759.1 putative acetyltransferase [Microbacterium sp. JAI119]
MSIVIERVQAASPALAEFLVAHHAELEHTAPAESRHALVFERLLAPGVRLFAAHLDDAPVATGALATVEEGHEEIKSMRTDPALRGQGLGRAMLAFLLADAESRGISRLSLETGSADFFIPARALYAAAGFRECGPFGGYALDPYSTFMTVTLPTAS